MQLDILKSVNSIVHDTAQKAVETKIADNTAGVINAFVNSIFGIAEKTLEKIVDITEDKPAS